MLNTTDYIYLASCKFYPDNLPAIKKYFRENSIPYSQAEIAYSVEFLTEYKLCFETESTVGGDSSIRATLFAMGIYYSIPEQEKDSFSITKYISDIEVERNRDIDNIQTEQRKLNRNQRTTNCLLAIATIGTLIVSIVDLSNNNLDKTYKHEEAQSQPNTKHITQTPNDSTTILQKAMPVVDSL